MKQGFLQLTGKSKNLASYEVEQPAGLKSNPNHIAIVMDGNGRWATNQGLDRIFGHLRGVHSVRKVVREARKLGIRHLTLFAFSSENWQRSPKEVSFIMRLLERYLRKEVKNLAANGIKLQVMGDNSLIPTALRDAITHAERSTSLSEEMFLTLAISYSGQDDLVNAARSLASECCSSKLKPSQIDRETLRSHLLLPTLPPVDLLIRSGGEFRISNFMLWQLAYAELIFLPILWPDFNEKTFLECITQFKARHRRYGRES